MPKLLRKITSLISIITLLLSIIPNFNLASAEVGGCAMIKQGGIDMPKAVYTHDPIDIKVTFDEKYVNYDWNFFVTASDRGFVAADNQASHPAQKVTKNNLTLTFRLDNGVGRASDYFIELGHSETFGTAKACDLGKITALSKEFSQIGSQCNINMSSNIKDGAAFDIEAIAPPTQGVTFELNIFPSNNSVPIGRSFDAVGYTKAVTGTDPLRGVISTNPFNPPKSAINYKNQGQGGIYTQSKLEKGDYMAILLARIKGGANYDKLTACSTHSFSVTNLDTSAPTPGKSIVPPENKLPEGRITDPTEFANTSAAGEKCEPGTGLVYHQEDPNRDSAKGINTAIGCIPTDPVAFTRTALRFSAGIGGGIALIMMIIASLQMMLSAGNQDRLKAGQDRFKNALIGLLFILFSVLLMRLIGVDILGLDKFLGV